ncbi:urease accessory protein UreE (plasmid) [Kovacikia minuta CCNUW1]|uniref:urease accessory protein UreE n=1 Tax=Kovacikia minuta TaxID=2931930 RepID=UPI001CCCD744|nr:urease accessory protein UreE [Kovacikia minuta]UBF29995.1 urease accessory protein UreE [Kovacikia minuta CCNUW1]
MDVITEVLGTLTDIQPKHIDPLLLTSEERLSPHGVVYTANQRKLRISLPRSTELQDGDVLAIDGEVAIVVAAAPEDLFVISPANSLDWGMTGFNLGNLHRSVRFTDSAILTPADPLVADLLTRLGIPFERQTIPFVGQRSSLQVSGHSHG